jgi:CheY-like chemotaxis protein
MEPQEVVTVVVIDDDDDVREGVSTLLALSGYTVHTAADGPSGLALVKEAQPACVLVDFSMPGMNGAEVARRLREHHAELVVIAITAFPDASDELEAAGADFVLTKPITADSLLRFLPRIETPG